MSMQTLFDFDIPYYFVNKVEEYNAILGQQQIDTIVSTIYLIDNNVKYDRGNYDKFEHLKKKNIQKCILWCQTHNIPYNKMIQNANIFLNSNAAVMTTPNAVVDTDVFLEY